MAPAHSVSSHAQQLSIELSKQAGNGTLAGFVQVLIPCFGGFARCVDVFLLSVWDKECDTKPPPWEPRAGAHQQRQLDCRICTIRGYVTVHGHTVFCAVEQNAWLLQDVCWTLVPCAPGYGPCPTIPCFQGLPLMALPRLAAGQHSPPPAEKACAAQAPASLAPPPSSAAAVGAPATPAASVAAAALAAATPEPSASEEEVSIPAQPAAAARALFDSAPDAAVPPAADAVKAAAVARKAPVAKAAQPAAQRKSGRVSKPTRKLLEAEPQAAVKRRRMI